MNGSQEYGFVLLGIYFGKGSVESLAMHNSQRSTTLRARRAVTGSFLCTIPFLTRLQSFSHESQKAVSSATDWPVTSRQRIVRRSFVLYTLFSFSVICCSASPWLA